MPHRRTILFWTEGERKSKEYEPEVNEGRNGKLLPFQKSLGLNTDHKHQKYLHRSSSTWKAAARGSLHLLWPDTDMVVSLSENTHSRLQALNSETCKASDSNTSSTGLRLCSGSSECYWMLLRSHRRQSTPASSWQIHLTAEAPLSTPRHWKAKKHTLHFKHEYYW